MRPPGIGIEATGYNRSKVYTVLSSHVYSQRTELGAAKHICTFYFSRFIRSQVQCVLQYYKKQLTCMSLSMGGILIAESTCISLSSGWTDFSTILLLLTISTLSLMVFCAVEYHLSLGASTPYKPWSKFSKKNIGGGFGEIGHTAPQLVWRCSYDLQYWSLAKSRSVLRCLECTSFFFSLGREELMTLPQDP